MGRSSAAGTSCPTIPQMAPAALARMRRDSGLRPRNIDRRIHQRYVLYADIGGHVCRHDPSKPISFGTPTGKVCMAAVAMFVPPPPPRGQDPVEPARFVQFRREAADAANHDIDGFSPASPFPQRRQRAAPGNGHLVCRNVRGKAGFAEHARIHRQRSETPLPDEIAHVLVFPCLSCRACR